MNYYSLLLSLLILISACSESEKSYSETNWESAKLVWSEEFESSSIDTAKWYFQTGARGWGNNEWQNYTPIDGGNATVENGLLKITAKLVGEGQKVGDYTSARINSKEAFLYGRMEVRAKMPDYKGVGLWPAIWMLGDTLRKGGGWPRSGEIDILEYISSKQDSIVVTIHTTANNHRDNTQVSSDFAYHSSVEEDFHNYGILWEEKALHFYLDEIDNILLTFERPQLFNQENWPFDKPFYFLLNMAVGGNFGGMEGVDDSVFPSTMEIDYVRVWQLEN